MIIAEQIMMLVIYSFLLVRNMETDKMIRFIKNKMTKPLSANKKCVTSTPNVFKVL